MNAGPKRTLKCGLLSMATFAIACWLEWHIFQPTVGLGHSEVNMMNFLAGPAIATLVLYALLTFFTGRPALASVTAKTSTPSASSKSFTAQVVGLVWLNPLQRRDYPTEWQLLWTLGLVEPNKNDELARAEPQHFSTVKAVSSIASGFEGTTTFKQYHSQYLYHLMKLFHDNYFSDSNYFYNVHSLTDRSTWRELAGIRVEYALPEGKLDAAEAREIIKNEINDTFSIGNANFPTLWSRSTPSDRHVTANGANAGFTSLAAAMAYLQANPNETVWVMSWDAPSRPLDEQINENLVLLVLAGPTYKTGRKPLAWVGLPATGTVNEFKA